MQSSLAELQRVFAMQKRHQAVAKASNADARINKLQRLKQTILRNQADIVEALATDLRRPRTSSPEFGAVIAEIDNAVIHLKKWMIPSEVTPSLPIAGASARIVREPRGVCALYGPWKFPILLVLQPLVAIVAAGNCAIVKPNELTPASSQVIARIIAESFDEAEVAVFEGGAELAEQMQELPFDHVFSTGSPAVGRTIMAAAARHLSSFTLELGGKCPVIIDHTVDLKDAADKIIVFSNDDAFVDNVLLHTSSGGVTHNDVILHAVDPGLPFGGINGSGIGRYHGIHGFNELSYERPVFSVPYVAKRG